MARKTAKNYFKDYTNITARLSKLEATIEKRAQQMVKKQPDVPYEDDQTVSEFMSDAIPFYDREDRVYACIDIIRKIEDHNLAAAGIVQKTIHDELNTQES